jgi:beta-propeller repeat-containing protein
VRRIALPHHYRRERRIAEPETNLADADTIQEAVAVHVQDPIAGAKHADTGTGSDSANAMALDALGNAYVAGLTQSTDFPLQTPFQNFNGGSYGGFVSKISPGWMAGVFLNGSWYLDYNGNGVWDGAAAGDRLYTFGQAGDKPVVGDWTGSGTAKIGVFRGGFWMLDANGNGQWDGAGTGDTGFWFGNSTYTPVVGDWSGSGTSKAGLFLNGTWYLDSNGDGQWVSGVDQAAYFGQTGDVPVAGDWSGSGKSR